MLVMCDTHAYRANTMAFDNMGFTTKTTQMEITRRGVSWQATLLHNNHAIGECGNDGNGGQTWVLIPNPNDYCEYQLAVQANAAYVGNHEPAHRFAELLADQEV